MRIRIFIANNLSFAREAAQTLKLFAHQWQYLGPKDVDMLQGLEGESIDAPIITRVYKQGLIVSAFEQRQMEEIDQMVIERRFKPRQVILR